MANLLTKIVINGVTVKDDSSGGDPNLVVDWEYERTIERGISEIDMTFIQTVNDTVTLAVGQTISIWTGFSTSTDTKRFEGFISDFRPEGGLIKITGKDKMWDLLRKIVNNVYLDTGAQAGQVSAIAKDLIETFGGLTSDEQATGTATGQTIAEFRCDQATIYERLMALAKAVQYQLFYDPVNDTVHFEPRGFTASGTTLTVGTDIIGVPVWENDTSMMVNDLRVEGAVHETNLRFPTSGTGQIETTANFENEAITLPFTPESVKLTIDSSDPPTTIREGGGKDSSGSNFFFVDKENKKVKPATGTTFDTDDFAFVDYTWLAPAPVRQRNQASIDSFGAFEMDITLNDIQTIADAEARTAQILSRFSTPFQVGEILVKSVSTITLDVGDTVTIVDAVNKPNINKDFIITKQTIKYPGSSQELVVGDEAIRMKDWQFNIEERMKRLEEENLKNQDLLQEIFDFQLTIPIEPRYRRIFTEIYNTTNLGLILNHSTRGLLNTNKLSTDSIAFEENKDHWIQQFEDSYTEDFIDDDFEDTNGTATGWTSGSVDFTSGQIALSKSVDFNNGTIIAATLNSTEVSGSFDYEMAADTIDPISHFKLNDNAYSTHVLDSFGSNDGTLNGGDNTEDKTATGKINEAFLLNGSDDFININDVLTNDLSANTAGTWAAWIKPVDATPAAIDILISFNDTSADEFIHLRIKTTGELLAKAVKAGVNQWTLDTDAAAFSDDTWTHIALVQDGVSPVLYINGVAVAQTFSTSTDKTAWFSDLSGLDNGRIGDRSVDGGGETNHFNGTIDDVRFYNVALSAANILSIYGPGGSGTEEQVPRWETVTPGTAHTFSNTGTDLKFRITENSASTGEISQATITNYH